MERNLVEMKVVMEKWGMRIHWGKPKIMMVSRKGEECKVSVEGEEVEEVKKLKYLRVAISRDGGCDKKIEQRIGAAARVAGAMRKIVLERRELQKTTKMRVPNAIVVPTLLYGCKTWTIQKRHESKQDLHHVYIAVCLASLMHFANFCLAKLLNCTLVH